MWRNNQNQNTKRTNTNNTQKTGTKTQRVKTKMDTQRTDTIPSIGRAGMFFLSLFCSRRGNRAKTEYQAENEKMDKTQTNLYSTNDSPNPLACTRGAKINIYAHAKNDHARTQKQRQFQHPQNHLSPEETRSTPKKKATF